MFASRSGPQCARSANVVGLNGVLVQRVAGAAADAQVLHGLKKGGGDGKPVELGTKPVDDFRRADLAFAQRLQSDVNESAVGGADRRRYRR